MSSNEPNPKTSLTTLETSSAGIIEPEVSGEDVALKATRVHDQPTNKPVKHYLDWILAGFALLSLLLNIYQYLDRRRESKIAQPGPNIFRTIMPIRGARIFYGLRERKDLLFSQFPNPGFVPTEEWERALSVADSGMTQIQLERNLWSFLTLRNDTSNTYKQLQIKSGDKLLASIGSLSPHQTLFMFYENDDSLINGSVEYIVQGDSSVSTLRIPPKSPTEIAIITELPSSPKLASLQGLDDRTKKLIQSKSSAINYGSDPP